MLDFRRALNPWKLKPDPYPTLSRNSVRINRNIKIILSKKMEENIKKKNAYKTLTSHVKKMYIIYTFELLKNQGHLT